MENFKLHKQEKLCSHSAIDQMFAQGKSIIAYPLRAVYLMHEGRCDIPARFMISIPKKKIRTAVGRVLLRRRTREAYRLNRALLFPALQQADKHADIAFTWLSKSATDYATIDAKMKEILTKIATTTGKSNMQNEPHHETSR